MPSDPLSTLGAPPKVQSALTELRTALVQAAGTNLKALLVYGAVARGHYRPGASDVDVAVVLESATPAALKSIAPALRTGFRAVRVDPIILTLDDLAHAADVFPTTFLAIQRKRVLLAGEDPFATLEIPRANVRLRVEQELRNVSLRLRRRFIAVHDDPTAVHALLRTLAPRIEGALHALLWMEGDALGAEPASPAAVVQAAAQRFGLDAEALAHLHDENGNDAEATLERVIRTLDQAAGIVDRWTGPSSQPAERATR